MMIGFIDIHAPIEYSCASLTSVAFSIIKTKPDELDSLEYLSRYVGFHTSKFGGVILCCRFQNGNTKQLLLNVYKLWGHHQMQYNHLD